MDDIELRSIIESKIHKSIGYLGGSVSVARGKAMDYYLGEPFGNEVEGRSAIVSTDVSDTVERIMPELMRIFESGGASVEFEPEGEQNIEEAKLASQYVNFIYRRDNQSFLNTYTWIKDALLQKTGVIKVYWDEEIVEVKKTLNGLSDDELAFVMQDESLEIIGHDEIETQPEEQDEYGQIIPAVLAHNIQVKTEETKGRVKIVPVPPEEFLIDTNARSLDDANFVAHRTRRTISELIEEGYDKNVLDTLPSYDEETDFSEEAVARRKNDNEYWFNDETDDPLMREIWLYESYLYVDYDGDGKTELRKITTGGNGYEILDNEEVDIIPFCAWSPIIMPHRFTGRSIADLIMDIQEIKSTLLRQYLDNLYASNNQRHVVNENVNLSDLLVSRPNGIIRTKGIPSQDVVPLAVQPLGSAILTGMEYIDGIKSDRTGVSDATAGMNPNVIANANTGVIATLVEKSQATIELIARVFAETGLKQAHKLILKNVIKYQDTERMVKFNAEWQKVNPAEWNPNMDMKVNVGLGTGNKDKKLVSLQQILAAQKEALAVGISTPEQIYNTLMDSVEAMGETASRYFQDPSKQPPQQPQPDQTQQLVQAEIHKKEIDAKQDHDEMIHKSTIELQKLALEYNVPLESLEAFQLLQQAEIAEQQKQMPQQQG